jgi:hypothetical protein
MKKRNIILTVVPLFIIALALLYTAPAFSYLPEYASKTPLVLSHWTSAPVWRINPSIGANVLGVADPTSVIAASFNPWKTAPNISGIVSGTTQGANTSITVHAQDGINLICFVCASSDFGSTGDTLAITYTAFSSSTGQIVDADILFNPADDFLSNGATCPAPTIKCADLQTVATHEIGHFYGLDHSAVTSAVLYPFAPDLQLNLGADDVAAISNTYPGTQTISTGKISGKITNTGSTGLCGIHVFADSNTLASGYPSPVRKTPVGAMTLSDGTYTITGLTPDTYTVSAEPMDGPADSTNIPDYATTICGSSTLSTNFTTRHF